MKHAADFQLDATLDEGKAIVTDTRDGDVIIEGWASDFGMDRQDEAFEPGAFQKGIDEYLERNPVLLYHHKPEKALGQVLELTPKEDGLWMKARVDEPTPGSWREDVVNQIKRGTIRALSVGGRFKRRMTANGPRIFGVDLREVSVTPLPVNPRTLFAVAGKAFGEEPFELTDDQKAVIKGYFESRLSVAEAAAQELSDRLCHNGR